MYLISTSYGVDADGNLRAIGVMGDTDDDGVTAAILQTHADQALQGLGLTPYVPGVGVSAPGNGNTGGAQAQEEVIRRMVMAVRYVQETPQPDGTVKSTDAIAVYPKPNDKKTYGAYPLFTLYSDNKAWADGIAGLEELAGVKFEDMPVYQGVGAPMRELAKATVRKWECVFPNVLRASGVLVAPKEGQKSEKFFFRKWAGIVDPNWAANNTSDQ